MARKPDRYPLIDPVLPDLYGRILEATKQMRTAQQAAADVSRMMARLRLSEEAAAVVEVEDGEPAEISAA